MPERLADLDELAYRCSDLQSREYIQEAVACYKAGAFRSAIVASWVAIAFDFLHKLRQLAATGHGDARNTLTEYENTRTMGDEEERKKRLMKFENQILEVSRDKFELIGDMEYLDLKRLFSDRNRCAHPSMQSLDEPFQPSAELARYHIRNAVTHFLQHLPAQGTAAKATIFANIDSSLFSINHDEAYEFFKTGHLISYARRSLVRSVMHDLVNSLLVHGKEGRTCYQYLSALDAVLRIHIEQGEQILGELLPRITEGLSDAYLFRIVRLLRHVPRSADFLGTAGKIKIREYVVSVPANEQDSVQVFSDAIEVPFLKQATKDRLLGLSTAETTMHLANTRRQEIYIESIIDQFSKVRLWRDAAEVGRNLVIPVAELMSEQQARAILNEFVSNNQIHDCDIFMPAIMEKLYSSFFDKCGSLAQDWANVYEVANHINRRTIYRSLLTILRRQFPDLRPEGWTDPNTIAAQYLADDDEDE